jgi:hypothetical protein
MCSLPYCWYVGRNLQCIHIQSRSLDYLFSPCVLKNSATVNGNECMHGGGLSSTQCYVYASKTLWILPFTKAFSKYTTHYCMVFFCWPKLNLYFAHFCCHHFLPRLSPALWWKHNHWPPRFLRCFDGRKGTSPDKLLVLNHLPLLPSQRKGVVNESHPPQGHWFSRTCRTFIL